MKKTLFYYLLKEIIPPFLVGIGIFVFILMVDKILKLTDLVVNKGLSAYDMLKLFYYLIPTFLVITIPIALVVSILLSFTRLSADSEIIAMKASGVSLYQLFPAVLTLSLICYLITAYLLVDVVPKFSFASRSLIFNVAKKKITSDLKARTFNDDFEKYVVYVEMVSSSGDNLTDVLIYDKHDIKKENIIFAKKGVVESDEATLTMRLRLFDGSIHRLVPEKNSYQKVKFETYDLKLNFKTQIEKGEKETLIKKDREFTIAELNEKINEYKKTDPKSAAPYITALHKRFSVPFACLVLPIMAIPLGISRKRGGKSWGFALSLFVILIYYLLLTLFETFGVSGKMNPLFAMWLPNFIIGGLGIYLYAKIANESSIFVIEKLNDIIEHILIKIKKLSERIPEN